MIASQSSANAKDIKGHQRTMAQHGPAWPSMANGKFGGSSASVQSFFCKTCSVWAMFSCSDRFLTSKESDGSNLDRGYLGFPNLKLQACVSVCLCVQHSPPDSCLPKWPVARHRLGEPDTVLEGCEGDLKCSSTTVHHAKTVNVVGNKMQNGIFPV